MEFWRMVNFEDKVIPLDYWITGFIDWLVEIYRWFFQALRWPVEYTLSGVEHGLQTLPPLLIMLISGFSPGGYQGLNWLILPFFL